MPPGHLTNAAFGVWNAEDEANWPLCYHAKIGIMSPVSLPPPKDDGRYVKWCSACRKEGKYNWVYGEH